LGNAEVGRVLDNSAIVGQARDVVRLVLWQGFRMVLDEQDSYF
jgi:hypothetical protein